MDSRRQIFQQAYPCGLISTTGWAEHTLKHPSPHLLPCLLNSCLQEIKDQRQTKEIPCMLTLTQVNLILLQVNFIYYFF